MARASQVPYTATIAITYLVMRHNAIILSMLYLFLRLQFPTRLPSRPYYHEIWKHWMMSLYNMAVGCNCCEFQLSLLFTNINPLYILPFYGIYRIILSTAALRLILLPLHMPPTNTICLHQDSARMEWRTAAPSCQGLLRIIAAGSQALAQGTIDGQITQKRKLLKGGWRRGRTIDWRRLRVHRFALAPGDIIGTCGGGAGGLEMDKEETAYGRDLCCCQNIFLSRVEWTFQQHWHYETAADGNIDN